MCYVSSLVEYAVILSQEPRALRSICFVVRILVSNPARYKCSPKSLSQSHNVLALIEGAGVKSLDSAAAFVDVSGLLFNHLQIS